MVNSDRRDAPDIANDLAGILFEELPPEAIDAIPDEALRKWKERAREYIGQTAVVAVVAVWHVREFIEGPLKASYSFVRLAEAVDRWERGEQAKGGDA